MKRLSLKTILAATLIASAAADDLVVSAAVDTFMGSADQATMVTNLGATTTGANLFKIANPGAVRFLRINADNTVDALSAADMLTALGTSAYAPSNVAITGGSALLSASASGGATLRVPHGTAPSSPTNGDLWTTTSSVFARVNGATIDLAATGSLANWTEAVSSTTPNAFVPAVSFTATNAATDVDASVVPKGAGALQAQVPNNATSGGNKRGAYSVDWQRVRSSAGQVAGGSGAVIGGGGNNTTSQIYPTIAGGFGNSVSGNYGAIAGGLNNSAGANGFVGGGESNSASAAHTTIGGGASNTASAGNATVIGGGSNTANGNYATAAGFRAHTKGIYGAFAIASGFFGAAGDAQNVTYLLRRVTTDATQTELTTNGLTPDTTTRITLPNNQAYKFTGQAVAREGTTGDLKSWDISGTIKRGANAAATAIVGSVTVTVQAADTGASAWTLDVDADTTNGALRIRGAGEAAKTIRWLVKIDSVENGG